VHKIIIVIRRNIDKVSGFPDIILGDICYMYPFYAVRKLGRNQKLKLKLNQIVLGRVLSSK